MPISLIMATIFGIIRQKPNSTVSQQFMLPLPSPVKHSHIGLKGKRKSTTLPIEQPFKRKRKRNQQDRFHTHMETNRHPSLNK